MQFENQILTNAVINTDYIEPRWFLEDVSSARASAKCNRKTQLYKSEYNI